MCIQLFGAALQLVLPCRYKKNSGGPSLMLPIVKLLRSFSENHRCPSRHLHLGTLVGTVGLGQLGLEEHNVIVEVASLDEVLDLVVCCKVTTLENRSRSLPMSSLTLIGRP